MKPITHISEYWTVHRWYEVGLIEVKRMTQEIDNLIDKRSGMDKTLRKPLSDQIVALRHDRARLQGKGMKMDKALKAYASDYSQESPSFWGFVKRLVGK